MNTQNQKIRKFLEENKIIIDKVLSEEGYVNVSPVESDSAGYRIAYEMKKEIRNHKWYMGESNIIMSWQEACNDWQTKYLMDFLNYVFKSKYTKLLMQHNLKFNCKIPNYYERIKFENIILNEKDDTGSFVYYGIGIGIIALLYAMIFIF